MAYDIQVLVQALLYLTICVTGFVISISLGVTVDQFDSQCILYTEFTWTNSSYLTASFSSKNVCFFPIIYSLFTCILYGLGMGLYNGYAALKTKDPTIGYQMWIMPFILTNTMILFVSLVSACVVSVGMKSTCDSFLDGVKKGSKLTSCSDADRIKWTSKKHSLKEDRFYSFVKVAESCAWFMVLFWIVQVTLCVIRFWRNRRYRSAGLEPMSTDPTSPKAPDDLENFATVNPSA